MTNMKKKRGRPRKVKRAGNGSSPMRRIILSNSYAAFQDESYSVILKCVEESLRDPEFRKKIDYHTREICKAIAERF